MSAAKTLDLTTLATQCTLSPGVRTSYVEAASVMLSHYHPDPGLSCGGTWLHNSDPLERIQVVWLEADAAMSRTHNNTKDATEDGAYAIAIAAVSALGFEICGRTIQGSGADFWMRRRGGDPSEVYHVEVSGIGDGGSPGHRLDQKVTQGQSGSIRKPGIAIVFRFEDASLKSKTWM